MKRKLMYGFIIIGMVSTIMGCSKTKEQKTDITTTVAEQVSKSDVKPDNELENANSLDKSTGDIHKPVTILVAAAASMEYSMNELIERFEQQNPYITVEGTYDSSGKLQTQIEEGLEADIFLSAATKQMVALQKKDIVDTDSIIELLENKIVLIVPTGSETTITGFVNILEANSIAIGDPESVPAGQYAKEIFESLGIYEEVAKKVSFGTNAAEVLNWIGEGSADAGVVYATDAATTDKVKVIEEAPEGSLASKVIYPLGLVSTSKKKEIAKIFVEFLQSDEANSILESYGFTVR